MSMLEAVFSLFGTQKEECNLFHSSLCRFLWITAGIKTSILNTHDKWKWMRFLLDSTNFLANFLPLESWCMRVCVCGCRKLATAALLFEKSSRFRLDEIYIDALMVKSRQVIRFQGWYKFEFCRIKKKQIEVFSEKFFYGSKP